MLVQEVEEKSLGGELGSGHEGIEGKIVDNGSASGENGVKANGDKV